ncbi:MAG: DUF2339 domain-containing protein [Holophagaceae bacterium]|nr:DUF2339 domain-containing protein [Holophagaceae bacterium]
MKKSPAYTLSILSLLIAIWAFIAEQFHATSNSCGTSLLIFTSVALAIVSIIRNVKAPADEGFDAKPLWDAIAKLRVEVEFLRKQIRAQENVVHAIPKAHEDLQQQVAVPPPLPSVIIQPARPTQEVRSPKQTDQAAPYLLKVAEPEPVAIPASLTSEPVTEAFAVEVLPQPEPPSLPVPSLEPHPLPALEPATLAATAATQPEAIAEAIPDEHAPMPDPAPVLPSKPQWTPPPPPAAPPRPPRPTFKPMPQLPAPEIVEKPRRNMEDFLGTQLFLKAGVAILVIGVVFAMGLVFQRMGHLGKLTMGYLGGLAMLGGGLFAEQKPKYKTFGRAIIAGAWGILYFVTYAGGFIEASKVFPSETAAIVALIIAASAAVIFSLRYRNEWTTTSAFLLIFLGLGMAAWELQPTFNLTSTLIVALAMAVLVWRTGWVRLLGFGVPATWGTLTFWIIRRPGLAADASLLITLLLCWAAFQLVLIFFDGDEDRERWIGLSQIGNFLGGFGLCLHQTLHEGQPWLWAAGFGLANLLVAWAYHRRGRRTMYLLAATEALAALALVTPLRLGWKHHLTPVYRLIGIEMLLVGGVVLKEKYFRRIAYGAFCFTFLDILFTKLDPALGTGRTLLLGVASGLWLLDSALLRTSWREVCDGPRELHYASGTFSAAGTFLLGILIWFEVPLQNLGSMYAGLALLWLLLSWLKGYKDAVVEAAILGVGALGFSIFALASLPGEPGTVMSRWVGAAGTALLLATGSALARRKPHENITEELAYSIAGCFGYLSLIATWAVLFRELPTALVAAGFGVLAVCLMGIAILGRYRDVALSALLTLAASLLILVFYPAAPGSPVWHISLHGWSLLCVAVSAFAMECLIRRPASEPLFSKALQSRVVFAVSIPGLLLGSLALYTEATAPWIAASFGLAAIAYLLLGLRWSHRDRAFEAYLLLIFGLFTLIAKPASSEMGWLHIGIRSWTLIGLAVSAFILEFISRRENARELLGATWSRICILFTSLTGLWLAVLALSIEVPEAWLAATLSSLAVLHLGLGILWSHRDRVITSFGLMALALALLWIKPASTTYLWGHISSHGWSLLGVALAAFLSETLIRMAAAARVLDERERQAALWFHFLTGLTLTVCAIWTEIPDPWVDPALAALSMLLLILGLLLGFKEQVRGSIIVGVVALTALGKFGLQSHGTWFQVEYRAWNLGILAFLALMQEWMLGAWDAAAKKLDEQTLRAGKSFNSLAGVGLLILLATFEFKALWVPGSLMAFGILWMVWARRRPSALHGSEALIFATASLGVIVVMMAGIWTIPGQAFGVPEHTIATGLALLLAYVLHREIHVAMAEDRREDLQLRDLLPGLENYGNILVILTTSCIAFLIKSESLAYHRNQLVPILWGALALAHFERGRAMERPIWPLLGHALLAIGLVHTLLINLLLDSAFMGFSLRLWSCLPFLLVLGLVYGLWKRFHLGVLDGDYEWLRTSYLYVIQVLIGAVLLYEMKRPYVLSAWAIQAVATLFIGVWKKDTHWLRAALLLAFASTLRAFAQNFYYWDAFALGGENLLALPAACAALLSGYVRLRLANPHAEADGTDGTQTGMPSRLLSGWHRMPWFIMQATLLAGFIWQEATGTSLTVWATLFGFGMVGLGFSFRERIARLLGLGILSACTLKLFIWDLRGLQGLPRVASFIALGVVLITVSFVYTRFKDRLEGLL